MTFIEFMNEVYKIVLEKIKEQTAMVLLLLALSGFFYMQSQKVESKLEGKIASVEQSLVVCNSERLSLSIMVAELKTKFEVLSEKEKRKK